MRLILRNTFRCALVALLLPVLHAPLAAQSPAKLRVAVVPFEGSAEVYYAQQSGAFARAGLDVEIAAMQSTGPIAAAVASNAETSGSERSVRSR